MLSASKGFPIHSPNSDLPNAGASHRPFRGLTDECCAQRAQEGQVSAMAEIVRRYTGSLFGFFSKTLSDRELATDFTQEVFLRIQKNILQFDSKRVFKTWLFTIAWNLARDHFRRKGRAAGKIVSLEAFKQGPTGDGGGFEPTDSREPSPDEPAMSTEDVQWVRLALDRLRSDQRAILVLREYEGLSYDELSQLLQCRVGTVKSRLNRARIELKAKLLEVRPAWQDDSRHSGGSQ